MAWVWHYPDIEGLRDAEFDYSSPVQTFEALGERPIPIEKGYPIYRTKQDLRRFERLHCPPIGSETVVDDVWKEIILRFVPVERIQFFPMILIGRGNEISKKFSWVIPVSRVRCIDPLRSDVIDQIERPDITLIFQCARYVHIDGCMGSLHLARDQQMSPHVVVSNELKEALSATGESSMFYQPQDVPNFLTSVTH